jgi:hypothetical protein
MFSIPGGKSEREYRLDTVGREGGAAPFGGLNDSYPPLENGNEVWRKLKVPVEIHFLFADWGFLMDLPKNHEYVIIDGGSTDGSDSRGNRSAEGVAE